MRRRGREKEEVAYERQWCIRMCGSESEWIARLCESGQSLTCGRVSLGRSEHVNPLKTQPPPISLQLKLHVVRVRKEVFGRIWRCDVDMLGDDGLWVHMKAHSLCSRLEVKGRKSERSDVEDVWNAQSSWNSTLSDIPDIKILWGERVKGSV